MKPRNQTADLLKGVAVILMIQVHIIELFASKGIYGSIYGKVLLFLGGPPVAPLFMVIFGYYIAASQKTFLQLIVRGLKIIALGMFLNLALNLNLIISVYKGLYQIDLLPYIFGVDIFQFAGLALIIIAVLKKAIEKNLFFLLLCILISTFLGNLSTIFSPETKSMQYVMSYFYGCSKWSYFPLFPWLAYPLSGIALYQFMKQYNIDNVSNAISGIIKKEEGQRFFKQMTGVAFFLFMLLTIRYAISIASDLPAYYHHEFIFATWTLVFLALYGFSMNEINQGVGEFILFKYIKWLGKNVTIIYILQWILIGNTATEIYKTINSPLYLLLSFFAILIVVSGISYLLIMLKEKFLKKLF